MRIHSSSSLGSLVETKKKQKYLYICVVEMIEFSRERTNILVLCTTFHVIWKFLVHLSKVKQEADSLLFDLRLKYNCLSHITKNNLYKSYTCLGLQTIMRDSPTTVRHSLVAKEPHFETNSSILHPNTGNNNHSS